MARSVDRYWGIYHIQTHLETYLDVHQLGFKAMILKLRFWEPLMQVFPVVYHENRIQSVLERAGHTKSEIQTRLKEIQTKSKSLMQNQKLDQDRYLSLHKIRVLRYT